MTGHSVVQYQAQLHPPPTRHQIRQIIIHVIPHLPQITSHSPANISSNAHH